MKTKTADIIAGIPSLNEADNISFVVEQVSKGLTKYFPDFKKVIVNVDNNSEDGTKEAFLGSKSEVPLKYISTPKNVKGKGNNFRNLFNYMIKSKAKAAIVVDADLRSITPEWVQKLGSPIIKGYDYVVPLYIRHKFDGTITNNVCFPLAYGLIGKNIRQPIAGDFAFSRKLCKYYLARKWNKSTNHYGIDIFMTLNAVFGGFKITQTCLGAKVHKPSAPKLGEMFMQVISSLFNTILDNRDKWADVKHANDLEITSKESFEKNLSLEVDDKAIKKTALKEYRENYQNIKQSLSPEIFAEVESGFSKGKIDISPELWARIVYDLLYMFSQRANSQKIIQTMRPLYFGRFYTFTQLTKDWDNLRAEKEFIKQAKIFRELRPYLLSKFKK